MTTISRQASVPLEMSLERLDRVAAQLFPEFSRSRLQKWIKAGALTVDGELRRPRDKVVEGDELQIDARLDDEVSFGPEEIPLSIVHEDEAIIVLDKPIGLVVHPGAGNPSGTLLNALLHHDESLAKVPRAGIVHRLDKDTSGLLVVARSIQSQNDLVQQLQARTVSRIYGAVVYGRVRGPGRMDAAIGRNPGNRLKMAVLGSGKSAITHYRILESFPEHTHLEVSLETGRTHQIRVHMEKLGHAIVGDPLYGHFRMPANKHDRLLESLRDMERQALHARRLTLAHPATGETVSFESPLPADISDLLTVLEETS
jgi:23S rRNA pseudouridine1911/1915/1917 synthase